MDIQTVRQVSVDYGISARMLRYYEQIGLLKSKRVSNYAYRVYDEDAVRRLQQVIILRKLQIPVKQIKDILINRDAVAAIEVFKQNIAELDERITALSAVRSILTRFVDEMQEKADVHLKLDLLSDKTMLAVVSSLSFPKNKIEERVSLDVMNRASEQLNKQIDKNVRIIYRPPATVASIRYNGGDSESDAKARKDAEAVVQAFIKKVDLFKIKPDFRVLGFGHGSGYGGWEMWVTVPDDFDVPAPLTKKTHAGGLYAATANPDFDIFQWVQNSPKYDWDPNQGPGGEEYVNPFNILGLKNVGSDAGGSMYTEHVVPVKEVETWTDEQKATIDAELAKIEKVASRGKTTDIDLATLVKEGDFADLRYADGLLIMKVDGYEGNGKMKTPQQFNAPLKIELRAKTDSTDITMQYAKGDVCFDDKQLPNQLFIKDIEDGKMEFLSKRGVHPIDEFMDIEWIIGREMMIVRVNGEIRHAGSHYAYIKSFKENPEYRLSSAVTVLTCCWATVTVEKLRITEI